LNEGIANLLSKAHWRTRQGISIAEPASAAAAGPEGSSRTAEMPAANEQSSSPAGAITIDDSDNMQDDVKLLCIGAQKVRSRDSTSLSTKVLEAAVRHQQAIQQLQLLLQVPAVLLMVVLLQTQPLADPHSQLVQK
jgi:hypothetical protein